MPVAPLTDAYAFQFKDLDLSGALVSWNDAIRIRLAGHEYLKRDGAEQEPMGAAAGRFTMRLVFLGSKWAKQYRALVTSIRQEPRGVMVHPLLGKIKVACEGIPDAAVTPATERDSISITLSFVEDAVDTALLADEFEGPSAKQSKIASTAASFTALLSALPTAVAAAGAFTSAAADYAAAAVTAATTSTIDPSLGAKLDATESAAAAAVAAIRADPAFTSDAAAYQMLSLAALLYAQCLELDQAVQDRLRTFSYQVPGLTDVGTIAAMFYGKDGLDRIDEILTNNRIPNPYAIRPGTTLILAAPTV